MFPICVFLLRILSAITSSKMTKLEQQWQIRIRLTLVIKLITKTKAERFRRFVSFSFLDNDDRMSSKRRNLSALVFLINLRNKLPTKKVFNAHAFEWTIFTQCHDRCYSSSIFTQYVIRTLQSHSLNVPFTRAIFDAIIAATLSWLSITFVSYQRFLLQVQGNLY